MSRTRSLSIQQKINVVVIGANMTSPEVLFASVPPLFRVCNSWFLRFPETSVFAAFPCSRVLNMSKFTVVPLFGRLFEGVPVGIERLPGRNLLMYLVPSWNFVGKTSFAFFFVYFLAAHLFAIDVEKSPIRLFESLRSR